jgi:P27 family predicted phage terminase small subunit
MKHRGRKNVYDLIEPPVLRPQLTAVPKATRRQPPSHLGPEECGIWKHVFAEFEIRTATAADVLVVTLEAHQRARECREVVSREGMTVTGRDNQQKVHPLLAVERDARAQFLAGIKQLGLEL